MYCCGGGLGLLFERVASDRASGGNQGQESIEVGVY